MHVEHHPGSYEIVHVKDTTGSTFATRLSNIFVIGQGKKPLIKLPKQDGVRLSLIAERNAKIADDVDDE
jgi:small subunit ribosomal protein S4e